MDLHDTALVVAGSIGIIVAIIHGRLMSRMMVRPAVETAKLSKVSKRLIPALMQFSTVCWLLGGISLIAAPFWFDSSARLTTAIIVGSFYTYGAIGNLWGTKGRHIGWLLLTVTVVLTVYGATNPL